MPNNIEYTVYMNEFLEFEKENNSHVNLFGALSPESYVKIMEALIDTEKVDVDDIVDYTEWRENLWEDLSANELFEQAADLNYTAPSGVQTI